VTFSAMEVIFLREKEREMVKAITSRRGFLNNKSYIFAGELWIEIMNHPLFFLFSFFFFFFFSFNGERERETS
jgi:hypothetical protein